MPSSPFHSPGYDPPGSRHLAREDESAAMQKYRSRIGLHEIRPLICYQTLGLSLSLGLGLRLRLSSNAGVDVTAENLDLVRQRADRLLHITDQTLEDNEQTFSRTCCVH